MLAALLFWLLLGPHGHVAHAATYDPELTWRTLRTEHFDIHFHQGIEQVADEFSEMVEEVYADLREELKWRLRTRVAVTLIDRTDAANGFATSVPYNAITVFVTAPTVDSSLNLYEDWSQTIFTHELTHVIHLETNHGIVRAARAVVGRVASTNDVSPSWMVEGLATFQETRHTPGGRGRSSWPDMIKRTAALEDAFPPLGNLDGYQPTPPSGNLRYLFGQDFIQYVADHTGRDVWTRWIHQYGSSIPFLLPSKKVFGRRLVPLYRDWRTHLVDRYEQQAATVRAIGETVGRQISDPEDSCFAPAFSPDGTKLVWSCVDLREGSRIWLADDQGFGAEVEIKDFGAGYFSWRADSRAFAYASTHIVNQFNVWSDVYMHTVGGGTVALTSGARARDPDFSPDGSRLLYVTNRAQNNQLATMTVDRRRQRLTDNEDHTQYSTPRHHPTANVVALSVWQDGRRDLWLYDTEGAPVRRLTLDAAIDADPVWSADGRWLYFSSDRTGIPNVFGIDVQTERLYQITNVVTGAVRPTVHPTGERMAYMRYSQDGWDIRMIDLVPEEYIDAGPLPRALRYGTPLPDLIAPSAEPVALMDMQGWNDEAATLEPARFAPRDPIATLLPPRRQDPDVLGNFEDTKVDGVFGDEQDYPFRITPRRYNPLPTLLPRYVLPFITSTPFDPRPPWDFACIDRDLFCPSVFVSLSSSATDALRRYSWSASVNYRTDANYIGANGSFTINRWLPVITFAAATSAGTGARLQFFDPDAPLDEDGELVLSESEPPTFYWEKRNTVAGTVTWPYRLRNTLFARYSFSDRRPRDPDLLGPNVYRPALPFIGTIGSLSGGFRYAWSQPTALSISPEDGEAFSFVGSVLSPWLGTFLRDVDTGERTPVTQLQLASELRRYVVAPWQPNHVFAGRVAAGATFGTNEFFGNYVLGGPLGDGGFSVVPDSLRMVRGYPVATDIGDQYWLASLEYRFPIVYIHRGLGTLPVWVRNVSGSVFIDAGNAFDNPALRTGRPATLREIGVAAVDSPLIGLGGELNARGVVFWGIALHGRAGWAIGLTDRGYRIEDGIRSFYFQLGGSF